MPEKQQAWCPWCRRWIYPVQHTGPGYFCPCCQEYMGMNLAVVLNVKPTGGNVTPLNLSALSDQRELAIA